MFVTTFINLFIRVLFMSMFSFGGAYGSQASGRQQSEAAAAYAA
jgi:hypothetical protein